MTVCDASIPMNDWGVHFGAAVTWFVSVRFPVLQSAVCDTPAPLPSYLYDEIKAISFVSVSYCQQLLEYLLYRLENSESCFVKSRSLRLIDYVLKNGNEEFRNQLRKNYSCIQQATGFNGLPDAVYGHKKYEMVRQAASQVLNDLFDESKLENSQSDIQDQRCAIVGMGSESSAKTMEGFGNAPMYDTTISSEKIMSDMVSMVDRMFNINQPSSQKKSGGLLMRDVDIKLDGFKAPVVEHPQSRQPVSGVEVISPVKVQHKVKTGRRKKGKAGGGWDDDDQVQRSSSSYSSIVAAEDNVICANQDQTDLRTELDYNFDESAAEITCINQFIYQNQEIPPVLSELKQLHKKCSSLNCEKLVQQLANILDDSEKSDTNKMRALIMVEVLLHTDFISPDAFFQLLHPTLLKVHNNYQPSPIKYKALKQCLIIEKLQKFVQEC
ncbi:AP-4 complex accessory subunit tepsin [Nymphon striatum]|nr:AP-4 complex accessory subunit tepsin [Nymphon striatum]